MPVSSRRPSPRSVTSIAARSAGVSTTPASASIAAARALASSCVIVQRLEDASLCDRVVSAEQQLRLAADRVADVLQLQPVRVRVRHLDALDLAVAAQLDHGCVAVPRIVEE